MQKKDAEKIEKLITKKTKAIMPVHLYGMAADMENIQEIADKHNLMVIGDAAQAHGATLNGKMVGSFGNLEYFSFYPTKNMTTSEGGMVTTNDRELFEKADSIRNHGREKTKWGYEHGRIGYNYRTTDIASAIGLEQLKKSKHHRTQQPKIKISPWNITEHSLLASLTGASPRGTLYGNIRNESLGTSIMFHADLYGLGIDLHVARYRCDQIIFKGIKFGWGQIRAVMDQDQLQALLGAVRTLLLSE